MSRASDALTNLAQALNDHDPACRDDPRFTLDHDQLPPGEVAHIGLTICRPCPLRTTCREYAETAKPPAGIWAGRTYQRRPRKDQP
ncbi:MAG: hypothetical protein BGO47_06740 [Microbacterium sp. 67-17]|uniref:WhiB family transcriptional regulator n=1 Tax=Microbacterium sp. 67-17 TaxID=1895782 RepID=UPI00095A7B63|nr:WhiB family transcriptional regulator [Microbacterium sp. 67-17]OJV93736.1 MAG: hypothetical protein BGO47_06740 [Microbacterium sp. 67-17]